MQACLLDNPVSRAWSMLTVTWPIVPRQRCFALLTPTGNLTSQDRLWNIPKVAVFTWLRRSYGRCPILVKNRIGLKNDQTLKVWMQCKRMAESQYLRFRPQSAVNIITEFWSTDEQMFELFISVTYKHNTVIQAFFISAQLNLQTITLSCVHEEWSLLKMGLYFCKIHSPKWQKTETVYLFQVPGSPLNLSAKDCYRFWPVVWLLGPKRKNTQVSFNLDQNQCVEFSNSDKPAIPAKRIQGYISSTGAAPGEGTQLSRPIPTRSARVRDLHPLGWASRFPARFPGTGQGQNSWPRMNLTQSIDLVGKSSTSPTRSSGMTKSPPTPTRAGCRDEQSPGRAGLVSQPASLRTLSPHKSQTYQNSLYQNGRESQLFSDVEFYGSAPRTSFDQPPFRQEIQHHLPVDMFHRIP